MACRKSLLPGDLQGWVLTHPHNRPRAAHKIAPNGARFLVTSCFWQGSTERSRPFPTNQPKVRNVPIYFLREGMVSAVSHIHPGSRVSLNRTMWVPYAMLANRRWGSGYPLRGHFFPLEKGCHIIRQSFCFMTSLI